MKTTRGTSTKYLVPPCDLDVMRILLLELRLVVGIFLIADLLCIHILETDDVLGGDRDAMRLPDRLVAFRLGCWLQQCGIDDGRGGGGGGNGAGGGSRNSDGGDRGGGWGSWTWDVLRCDG